MSVEIRLTSDQFPHYEFALKKANIAFEFRGTLIELHRDNFHAIVAALRTQHTRSRDMKTKSIVHMERLYNLEHILKRVEAEGHHFPLPPQCDPVDDSNVQEFPVTETISTEVTEEGNNEEMKKAA